MGLPAASPHTLCRCRVRVCAARRLFEHNLVAKALWHTYFCHSRCVALAEFLLGLRLFLRDTLHMKEEEVAALLCEANQAALGLALDLNGDGEVGRRLPRVALRAQRVWQTLCAACAVHVARGHCGQCVQSVQ